MEVYETLFYAGILLSSSTYIIPLVFSSSTAGCSELIKLSFYGATSSSLCWSSPSLFTYLSYPSVYVDETLGLCSRLLTLPWSSIVSSSMTWVSSLLLIPCVYTSRTIFSSTFSIDFKFFGFILLSL